MAENRHAPSWAPLPKAARPVLLVLYDRGSAGPVDIITELPELADLVILARRPDDPSLDLLAGAEAIYPLDETVPPALLAQLRRHRPDGLVTFSEGLIPVAATLAAELGLISHSPATAGALTSKDTQRRLLRDAGVDAVRFHRIEAREDWPDAVREVGLPCVVKPVRSEGSRNTYRIDSADEGDELVGRLLAPTSGQRESELIAEELLPGRELWPFGDYVSVESVVVAGAVQNLAVTGKLPLAEPFRETCSYWPSAVPAADQAAAGELTTRALTALGVTDGVCHTELKLTPAGPRVIEVNGRLGGYVHDVLKRSCGLSMIGLAASVALGRQSLPVPVPQPRQVSYIFNNLPPDGAVRLVAASGIEQVQGLDGVTSYWVNYRPGDRLAGGVSTYELDLLRGAAADHAAMLEVIRAALGLVRFSFDTGGEAPLTLTGSELPSAAAVHRPPAPAGRRPR
jgi:hypothetical protein